MRIRILFDADADPGYQNDVDPSGSGSTALVPSHLHICVLRQPMQKWEDPENMVTINVPVVYMAR